MEEVEKEEERRVGVRVGGKSEKRRRREEKRK